jgi:hypothetical protein
MDRRALFLETLEDLRNRITPTSSEYGLLQAAAKVRLLLVDGTRLVDLVNRDHRLKITYRIGTGGPLAAAIMSLGPSFMAIGDALDPDSATPQPPGFSEPVVVGADGLLSAEVIFYENARCTVADVVKYLAHVAGGVHAGSPTTREELALATLSEEIEMGGLTPGSRTMMAIGRVVLAGLEPLRREVVRDLSGGQARSGP